MRLSHASIAFSITSLLIVDSIYRLTQNSGNYTVIVINYCVLFFYFGHFIWAIIKD